MRIPFSDASLLQFAKKAIESLHRHIQPGKDFNEGLDDLLMEHVELHRYRTYIQSQEEVQQYLGVMFGVLEALEHQMQDGKATMSDGMRNMIRQQIHITAALNIKIGQQHIESPAQRQYLEVLRVPIREFMLKRHMPECKP